MNGQHVLVSQIVPSEELRALVFDWYGMWERRDVAAFERLFTASPSLLVVGSDEAEWMTGTAAVNVFMAQLVEQPGVTVTGYAPTAYCRGDIGWVADKPVLNYADGLAHRVRYTATLALESEHWRIVQWHASLPQPNVHQLTTSVETLAQVVRQDRPELRPASAPDGTVTVVFSDIESSTVLLERLGDLEFMQLLAWHDRLVRDCTEEHGGFVVKSQGDGFMLAFPSAAYALRASVLLRDRLGGGYRGIPVRVRTGMHVGEAVRHADDFYGRTVVIAARIGSLAIGGEILASGLVHALAQGIGTFAFGPPRTTTLKGIDGTLELYPVVG